MASLMWTVFYRLLNFYLFFNLIKKYSTTWSERYFEQSPAGCCLNRETGSFFLITKDF